MQLPFKLVLRVVIFLLGLYEFGWLINFYLKGVHAVKSDFLLNDADLIVMHKPALYLNLIFIFFLGLNRVCWAAGVHFYPKQNHFWSWMNLVLTHAVELFFFLNLAMLPHFNTSGDASVVDVYLKGINQELGNQHSRDILLVVPTLLLMTLLHGPNGN